MRNIIGRHIQFARNSKNITQEDLAVKLQVLGFKHTRNTIAKIENGFRQITDIEIKAIADVLDVPIDWLFQEGHQVEDSKNILPQKGRGNLKAR